MTGNTKTLIAGGVVLTAAFIYLYFKKKKVKAAAGGSSGGSFTPFGSIPLFSNEGTVIAVIPVVGQNNDEADTIIANCSNPLLERAYLTPENHLKVEWIVNGNNYNYITIETSIDNGVSWQPYHISFNVNPFDMGTSIYDQAKTNNIDNIRVRLYGNCNDGKRTARTDSIIVPIS